MELRIEGEPPHMPLVRVGHSDTSGRPTDVAVGVSELVDRPDGGGARADHAERETDVYALDVPHRILHRRRGQNDVAGPRDRGGERRIVLGAARRWRSEEHTSELQSHLKLVCRLL